MEVRKLKIGGIPAMLFGADGERTIIAVHGSRACKIDDSIWILAEEATPLGCQVLSFDLPGHGERAAEETKPCMIRDCVEELRMVIEYAEARWEKLCLFGCSIGAYAGLVACQQAPVERAWFLSPVTDMEGLIRRMMEQFGVTEERLRAEGMIDTLAEPLSWDCYCYVKDNPVAHWSCPTFILRGEKDDMCEYQAVKAFADRFCCELEEQKGGEHWFHTPDQLAFYRQWLCGKLKNDLPAGQGGRKSCD